MSERYGTRRLVTDFDDWIKPANTTVCPSFALMVVTALVELIPLISVEAVPAALGTNSESF